VGIVLEKIVEEVIEDNERLFALIVDEAGDISIKEQISIWIRHTNKTKVFEWFL